MRNFLFYLSLIVSSLVFGQEELVRQWTKELCSPQMHGRGYVSGGDSIAAKYLEKEYTALGLTAVPGQSSMLQSFTFPVNSFPGDMQIRQGETEVEAGKDYIVKPNSGSFRGELNPIKITHEDYDYIVRRRRFLANYADNEFNSIVVSKKGLNGDSLKRFSSVLDELSDLMPVVELYEKKFTWSVAREAKKFPYILFRDSVFTDEKLTLNIENKFIKSHTANNVVAYLPAKKKTDKTIYFTAHYDHLGRMGSDIYFPGGNDNASGTAILLSLAKYFKANPSKYNIVFIAFAGEEAGLIGSHYYVQNPLTNLEDIRFLLNLDIMGSGEEGITIVNATLFKKAFKKFTKINKKNDYLKAVKSRGPAANSDHYFFTEAGVPAVFIYTQGHNKHYHDIFDTYEELSFAEYNDLVELLKCFVRKI